MEYKTALRAALSDIRSDAEHLAWMREHVGEPVEVDEEDADDLWFSYRRRPFDEPYLKDCCWRGVYGVELVLLHDVEDPSGQLALTVDELLEHVERLRRLVGDSPIKLFSYSWYNGGDEPISW
jgi:hypothetical protein